MTIPRKGIYKNCVYCGSEFYVPQYRKEISKYCSRPCQHKSNVFQLEADCLICGKRFSYRGCRANTAKYCSSLCYHRSQLGRGRTQYTCRHCSKIFFDSASTERVYCSKQCVNKDNKDVFVASFTTVRDKMKRRGMIKECCECGYKEVPEILGIHHRDGNRKNNTIENLMVLCPMCHSLIHRKHICHRSLL
jgi:hypothetical protein